MTSSLISGLSGLRTHQNWIDVIGNNLANSSTPGFKSSRALFADLISRELRPATPPSGNLGGTNPVSIGLGVDVGHIDRNMNQGALNITGRTFDLAIDGRGFFSLTNGVETFYTRVGTFGLDAANNMVDLRTGFQVLDAGGQPFSVDTASVVPPSATTTMGVGGNLPAQVSGPLAEVLTSSSAFAEGSPAQTAVGTAAEPFAIPAGQTFTMELVVDGGAPQTVSVTSTTGSVTAAEVATAINALDHVTASVVGGALQLTTDRVGSNASIKVNPGASGQDLASVLGLQTSLVTGTESPAGLTSDLNDLTGNLADYQTGDFIEMSATGANGTPVQASFEYGVDGTTLGDLVTFLDNQFADATVAFDATSGQLSVTADATGEATLSITLLDSASQAGAAWADHAFGVTTDGAGPDTASSSIEIFDAAGTARLVTMDFERQDDGTWNLMTSIDPNEGTVVAGTIAGITFNPDGSVATPATGQVTLQFNGQSAQTISIELGTPGQFDGLTQFGNASSVLADSQDGYGAGELSSIAVGIDGTIQGFYSNGQLQDLGSFGVSTFTNEQGLRDAGNNFFLASANTGTRVLSSGAVGAAGTIRGGAIEESNVDTAQEFVRMIQAQRGFQANARVISVQDELLNETVNLI